MLVGRGTSFWRTCGCSMWIGAGRTKLMAPTWPPIDCGLRRFWNLRAGNTLQYRKRWWRGLQHECWCIGVLVWAMHMLPTQTPKRIGTNLGFWLCTFNITHVVFANAFFWPAFTCKANSRRFHGLGEDLQHFRTKRVARFNIRCWYHFAVYQLYFVFWNLKLIDIYLHLPRPDLDADPADPFLLQHQLEDAYMLYRKCFQGNSLRINIVCEFYILFLIIKVLFFQCQVLPQTLSNSKNASGISDRRCINSSICLLAACATRLFIFRQSHAKYLQNTHCGKQLHPVNPQALWFLPSTWKLQILGQLPQWRFHRKNQETWFILFDINVCMWNFRIVSIKCVCQPKENHPPQPCAYNEQKSPTTLLCHCLPKMGRAGCIEEVKHAKKQCVSHGYHTKNDKPLHVRKIESLTPANLHWHANIQMYTCWCLDIYIYIHLHLHLYAYIYIYICVCTFIYLYVCTCIYFSFVSVVWPW